MNIRPHAQPVQSGDKPGTPRKTADSRKGGTLLLVLIVIAIGFSVTTGVLYSALTVTRSTMLEVKRIRAKAVAEDGVRLARFLIESEPDWEDELDGTPFVDTDLGADQHLQVSGTVLPAADDDWSSITVQDPGFELASNALSHPLFGPPSSGWFGAWRAQRYGLVNTGLTVPAIGVMPLALTTEGNSGGYARFLVAVDGWARFSQETADELEPNTRYRLSVDIGTGGVAALLSDIRIRLLADGDVLADSSIHDCLTLLDLGAGYSTYQVEYETDDSPPSGFIEIQLEAGSLVGLLTAAAFDHVRLEHQPIAPTLVELVSVGQHQSEPYTVRTTIAVDDLGPTSTRVVSWMDE